MGGSSADAPVYATLSVPGVGCVSTPVRTIHLGPPTNVSLINVMKVPMPYYGITGTVVTDAPPPYYWYIDGVLKKTTTSTQSDVVPGGQCNVQHYFQVGVTNGCGAQIKTLPYYFTDACGVRRATDPMDSSGSAGALGAPGFSMTPNPARSVAVHILQQDGAGAGIRQIIVYTTGGQAIQRYHYAPGTMQADISTDGLSAGIYFVEIFDGTKYERKKLVVQH